VPLTRKEFGVLEAVLAADGAVISAEELLESVWDEHAEPFSNTVSVTIARLRRKLGEPPLIETVIGSGYRLRVPDQAGPADHAAPAAYDPAPAHRHLQRAVSARLGHAARFHLRVRGPRPQLGPQPAGCGPAAVRSGRGVPEPVQEGADRIQGRTYR
jgi:DNA-binding winged helix-turn-helix (wHTH) protein